MQLSSSTMTCTSLFMEPRLKKWIKEDGPVEILPAVFKPEHRSAYVISNHLINIRFQALIIIE